MLDILPVIGAFILGLLAGSFLACWWVLRRGRRIAQEHNDDLRTLRRRAKRYGFLIDKKNEEVVCFECGNTKGDACHDERKRLVFINNIKAHNLLYNRMLLEHFGVYE